MAAKLAAIVIVLGSGGSPSPQNGYGGLSPRGVELGSGSAQPTRLIVCFGSGGRTRTYDLVVNSHPLCQLSYAGTYGSKFEFNIRQVPHAVKGKIPVTRGSEGPADHALRGLAPAPDGAPGGPSPPSISSQTAFRLTINTRSAMFRPVRGPGIGAGGCFHWDFECL